MGALTSGHRTGGAVGRAVVAGLVLLALLTAAAAGAAAQPVELEYWHFYAGLFAEMHDELVKEFNEAHPHIRVRPVYGGSTWTMRDKLTVALSAGRGPDVASIDQFWIAQLASGGYVVPVEEFFDKTPGFDAGDILPVYWETARYRGRIWSMPFAASTVGLYYNKDLMRSLGLTEKDVPRTWSELVELGSRVLQDHPNERIWILDVPTTAQTGVVYYFLLTLWQRHGDMFADDYRSVVFHSQEGVETLAFWQDMVRKGLIDLHRPDRAWESGRALFHIQSSARILSAYANLPFEFGMAPLPYEKERVTGIGGRNLAILTDDPVKQEAAWTFIVWMTNGENNRRWSERTGYSPLRRSSYASAAFQELLRADPRVETALHEMLYARPRPNIAAYGDASRVLGEAVERALYFDLDPAAVLQEAAAEANAVIQRYGEDGP